MKDGEMGDTWMKIFFKDAKAELRTVVKRILRKYGCQHDKQGKGNTKRLWNKRSYCARIVHHKYINAH